MLDLSDLIQLCKSFRDMDSTVTDQGEAFIADPDSSDTLSRAALDKFTEWLLEVADVAHEFDLSMQASELAEEYTLRHK